MEEWKKDRELRRNRIRKERDGTMSNKVNRKNSAQTTQNSKKKDPLAKKRNAARILALIIAVVMVLGTVLPVMLYRL